ncbi:MAG: ATP synthase F0 subunit B [Oscillospiraceae bacterium]|jgi:F-type H+-transporting ATPase subunit b|nr:ATP synthase F0 subunit B [Oscillospiraceae bacterium]
MIVPKDLLLHVINVLVTFFLLRLILWKPIQKVLAARRERVERELAETQANLAASEAAKVEYDRQLAEVDAQGRELIREAQQRAAENSDAILADARSAADHLLAETHERIEGERRRAVLSARQDISALAGQLASSVLRREVEADDDIAAVDDFFKGK